MSVTVDITNNQVTVSEAVTNIVEVRAIGPKGSPGSPGVTQATGSLLLTASISDDILTFTKGNSDTFSLTLPSGIDTGSLLITASVSDNIVTFEKGDSSTFDITIISSSFATLANSATTASYVLADRIDDAIPAPSLTITSLTSSNFEWQGSTFSIPTTIYSPNINGGIISASTLQGAFSFDNLIDVPVFVDTTGEPSEHQLAVFVDTTDGLPENLPFNLPLVNDGNPTVQGLSGLIFSGSSLNITGNISASGDITASAFSMNEVQLRSTGSEADLSFKWEGTDSGFYLDTSNSPGAPSLGIPEFVYNGTAKLAFGSAIVAKASLNLDSNQILVSSSTGISSTITPSENTSSIFYSSTGSQYISGGISTRTHGASLIFQTNETNTPANNDSSGSIINETGQWYLTSSQMLIDVANIDFTKLPTSDPQVSGRLYQTGSSDIGADFGFQLVCISQG